MLLIETQHGLGDCVLQRPFIRAAAAREPTRLATPWPEVFHDLPVRFERLRSRWRCQSKNIARQPPALWAKPAAGFRRVEPRYTWQDLQRGSITAAFGRYLPLGDHPYVFDLPAYGSPIELRRYAVVRPSTIRREWPATARAPRPDYLQSAIDALKAHGLAVVTVADVDGIEEWFVAPPQRADLFFHKGELGAAQLIGLIQGAVACVGGVGWIVPMAIAAGVPLLVILGGRGAHNAPEVITDPRMDLSRTRFATPDRFCRCDKAEHDCDKTISGFDAQLATWVASLS